MYLQCSIVVVHLRITNETAKTAHYHETIHSVMKRVVVEYSFLFPFINPFVNTGVNIIIKCTDNEFGKF